MGSESLQKTPGLFGPEEIGKEKDLNSPGKSLLDKYVITDMNYWKDVDADLIITDPPFGIDFSGKNGNYHRNVENVVDGYVEWKVAEYGEKIQQLLVCIKDNLKKNGQGLILIRII